MSSLLSREINKMTKSCEDLGELKTTTSGDVSYGVLRVVQVYAARVCVILLATVASRDRKQIMFDGLIRGATGIVAKTAIANATKPFTTRPSFWQNSISRSIDGDDRYYT